MIDDDEAYERFQARDATLDGKLWMGVMTTGIYCRPVCPGRPLRKNVRFFEATADARAAGLRACKRCKPGG
jgi:methylphosphotriester-DNA--protein-cysteine methyltransferase